MGSGALLCQYDFVHCHRAALYACHASAFGTGGVWAVFADWLDGWLSQRAGHGPRKYAGALYGEESGGWDEAEGSGAERAFPLYLFAHRPCHRGSRAFAVYTYPGAFRRYPRCRGAFPGAGHDGASDF